VKREKVGKKGFLDKKKDEEGRSLKKRKKEGKKDRCEACVKHYNKISDITFNLIIVNEVASSPALLQRAKNMTIKKLSSWK